MEPYLPFIDWIDTQKSIMLDRVKRWVAINSHSSNNEGLKELALVVQNDFRLLNGEAHLLQLGSRQKPAIRIEKRDNSATKILLCGHLDTVFAATSPFQSVHEVSDKLWVGPGLSDMKGGIAVILTALEALENSSFARGIGWEVLLTPDEEIGSPDSSSLYEEAAKRNDLGLVFEPSFPDGAFVTERMGSLNGSLTVSGKAVHVGRDYKEGRSASFALSRFLYELELYCKGEELIVNATNLEVKGPLNIVPEKATCLLNFRAFHEQKLLHALKKSEEIAEKLSVNGIKIIFKKESYRNPKIVDKNALLLYEAYQECAQKLMIPFSCRETGGVCDGNILAAAGLPVIDSAGVTGGALHTIDEYLLTDSLVERAKLAALFLMRLANGDFSFNRWREHD